MMEVGNSCVSQVSIVPDRTNTKELTKSLCCVEYSCTRGIFFMLYFILRVNQHEASPLSQYY